ncbi:MAG: carboxymuconolactone decarboxylase family protein [Saprospiraceae bacterium]
MNKQFDRKIFTAGSFFSDLYFLMSHFISIAKASKNEKISKAFIEKIMTVCTAVNGCVYCEWFHAKQAVKSGISESEVKNMINLQFHADASDFEIPALLYTQHFAETNRNPDAEMTNGFKEFYGLKTSKDIYMFIRMIYFGNLTGNTWDAIFSRFKGKPAPNSKIWFEILFFILMFIFMFPIMILMRMDKNKKDYS